GGAQTASSGSAFPVGQSVSPIQFGPFRPHPTKNKKLYVLVMACCAALCWACSACAQECVPSIQPLPALPPPQMRVAAEWEPLIGVLIGWPLELPPDLVIAMSREVDLYVTVANCLSAKSAARHLSRWGIDAERVHFIVTEQGRGYYLARDWGPFAVF